mgnify:CR=1 FL=1
MNGGLAQRLIPAYAGSTRNEPLPGHPRGAHPRLRGEHVVGSVEEAAFPGSSPLTRGALDAADALGTSVGLIPAYAGSTRIRLGIDSDVWAHPRLRGEHSIHACAFSTSQGSSPLTRGARLSSARLTQHLRLIPAYAGSTSGTGGSYPRTRAHPRLRGEHPGLANVPVRVPGSSPLTRGAQPAKHSANVFLGLIPAYAGST